MRTFTIITFLITTLIVARSWAQEQTEEEATVEQSDQPQIVKHGELYYIHWGEKRHGPHDFVLIVGVFEDKLLYSSQDEDRLWTTHWGEQHYGPYKDLMVAGVYQGKILFYCMQDEDYYIHWGDKRKGPYDWVWKLRYEDDGRAHFRIRVRGLSNEIRWDGN